MWKRRKKEAVRQGTSRRHGNQSPVIRSALPEALPNDGDSGTI